MAMDTGTTESKNTKTPSLKDDYVARIEAQTKEWDAQLALWGAKADKATTEVKADFHKWQRDFMSKRTAAQEKMASLKTSNQDAWADVKKGVESAWTDVKSAFESARSKYN